VYLWNFFFPTPINLFFWTSLLTGLAFFLVGWLKSSVNQTSAVRGITETVLLGLLAAVVAYFVGDVLEQFFG
jgi:VIT1/CCC1 family predicted Fe2+/Mn2+ transporter